MSASRCIVVDRLAAGAIPHQRGLALVGDADRGEIPRGKPGPGDCLAAGRHHRAPQILRIMFNPAGLWEVLRNFPLGDGGDGVVGAEHGGAGGGGALVDGGIRSPCISSARSRIAMVAGCRRLLH
jgi:hypothetical protein